MKPAATRRAAVADYAAGRLTLAQIAQIHRVSPMTVYWWAQKAGLPHRRRGASEESRPDGAPATDNRAGAAFALPGG
jgi:transposase-like protein